MQDSNTEITSLTTTITTYSNATFKTTNNINNTNKMTAYYIHAFQKETLSALSIKTSRISISTELTL